MTKREFLISVVATFVSASVTLVEAQQPDRIRRIGYVSGTGDPKNPGPQIEAFRQGLRDLGYVERKSILIEYRYQQGNPRSHTSHMVSK
jgi:putative ABC transport system substrate-binding protein